MTVSLSLIGQTAIQLRPNSGGPSFFFPEATCKTSRDGTLAGRWACASSAPSCRCRGLVVLAAPHRGDNLATVGILLHSQGLVTGRVVRRSTGAQHGAQEARAIWRKPVRQAFPGRVDLSTGGASPKACSYGAGLPSGSHSRCRSLTGPSVSHRRPDRRTVAASKAVTA